MKDLLLNKRISSKNYLNFLILISEIYKRNYNYWKKANYYKYLWKLYRESESQKKITKDDNSEIDKHNDINLEKYSTNLQVLPNLISGEINQKIDAIESITGNKEKNNEISKVNLGGEIAVIKESIYSINRMNEMFKENIEKQEGSHSLGLLDIIGENYRGVSINISLTNSTSLTGEVLKIDGGVLSIRHEGIIYYVDKDKIVYFY